jgi:hypothetical protein
MARRWRRDVEESASVADDQRGAVTSPYHVMTTRP